MTSHQSETQGLTSLRAQWRHYVRVAIVCGLSAWLASTLYETLLRIGALYVPMPVGDYWRVAQHLKDFQTFHLSAFWEQHNEHRIVFPELVFAVDMLWGHGKMIWPTAVSFLCYLTTWLVLCATLTKDRNIGLFDKCCGVLVAGVLVFWQGSALALGQPFLLEWTLMQVAVALALYFLKKAADGGRGVDLAIAMAAGAVATYSSGNALLLWPLLIALALLMRLTKRFLLIVISCAALFDGLYFVGYRFTGDTNLLALLQHPGYFISFTAMYLSMPFGNLFSPSFGVSLGLVNLGVVVLIAVVAWRRRLLDSPEAPVLLGYYAFTLLTIFITAAGRMNPGDPTYGGARAPRYLTVPFMNWVAVVLLCYWIGARLGSRWLTTRGLTLGYVLLLSLGVYKLHGWFETNLGPFRDEQVAAMSLDVELTDSELIGRIFPAPEFLEKFLPPLKKQHLAGFNRFHEKWFGKNIHQFGGTVLDAPIKGHIIHVHPVEHGLEVEGWVNSRDVRDPFPRILLANELGQTVGWGRRPTAGFPEDWITPDTPEHEAWVAFANLEMPSKRIAAYALTRKGVVQIPGFALVPALEGAGRYEVSEAVRGAVWQIEKPWAQDGIPSASLYGWHPVTTLTYSSWQQNDANTGQASVDFSPPATGCFAMGVLHGPSIAGLSAQFFDADTGQVLGDVPFRDHDTLWSLWKLRPGPNVKHMRFVATDNGKDWGQWLAVSGPVECH